MKHINDFKLVTLPDLKVCLIMGRSDFQRPCAELHVNMIISDDFNLSHRERSAHFLTNQVLKTLIFWVNCHSRIPHQGFRTGG